MKAPIGAHWLRPFRTEITTGECMAVQTAIDWTAPTAPHRSVQREFGCEFGSLANRVW